MIRRFRDKGLERLFVRGESSGVAAAQSDPLRRILLALHSARGPRDMALPGFRLHPLKGQRSGEWAVAVSGNRRVVFRFRDGDAVDVDLVDYH